MLDAGCEMLDGGCKMLDARCEMPGLEDVCGIGTFINELRIRIL